jgi:DNA processing protein
LPSTGDDLEHSFDTLEVEVERLGDRQADTTTASYEKALVMDRVASLELALAATRHGGGATGLARRVRTHGFNAFSEILDPLPRSDRDRLSEEAEDLAKTGHSALLMGLDQYPRQLLSMKSAPPVLFCRGPIDLLTSPGVGICGSRSATEEGLRAASACGEVSAEENLAAISGYARGVDTAAHLAALRQGGSTVIVLPEGISRFRVKRDLQGVWDPGRTLVVSQFSPSQPWSAGAAMTRNNVIIGLGIALLVVEAGETGGTLAAGMSALDANRRVIALEFSNVPRGNALLLDRGAIPVRSRSQLSDVLRELDRDGGGNQLSIV